MPTVRALREAIAEADQKFNPDYVDTLDLWIHVVSPEDGTIVQAFDDVDIIGDMPDETFVLVGIL